MYPLISHDSNDNHDDSLFSNKQCSINSKEAFIMAENNLKNSISKLKKTVDNDFSYFNIQLTDGAELYLDPENLTASKKISLIKERDKIQSLIKSVIVLSYLVNDFNKKGFDQYQRFDFVALFVNNPLGKIMEWIKAKSRYQSVDSFDDELNNLTGLNNIYDDPYGATLIVDFLVACQNYVDYGKKVAM